MHRVIQTLQMALTRANEPVSHRAAPDLNACAMEYLFHSSKYADGLPLYRMEQVFHRAGIQIGRGTMGHWLIGASQRHLQRLYDAMHHVLLTQPLIHGDETTLQVLHEAGRH